MDLFNEEQRITLFFEKGNNIVEMTCGIEKVHDDRLDLLLPQYFMRYIEFLQVGKELTAKVFSKVGTVDFNTIVISSPLEETFSIELDYNSMKIHPSEETPFINTVETVELKKDIFHYKLKTFQISTEFVKFTSDKTFKVGDKISGTLYLPKDYGIIKFMALITEIDPIYDNEYTAHFETMTEASRQALLYYMYMYTKDFD